MAAYLSSHPGDSTSSSQLVSGVEQVVTRMSHPSYNLVVLQLLHNFCLHYVLVKSPSGSGCQALLLTSNCNRE